MNVRKHRGILTSWKDDKGFGFIKPDVGTRDVFLHVSAVKGASRRPRPGDTIFYELTTEPNGKVRASNASIEGVMSNAPAKRCQPKSYKLLTVISILSVIAIATPPVMKLSSSDFPLLATFVRKPGCNIKGNISIETGNRLYHIPGMEDYESTRIDSLRGERWFCTESEAIASGWRKAPR